MSADMTAEKLFKAGMILFTSGEYGNSISLFTEAITLDPDYEPAYLSRGSAFMREARMPEAISDFTAAISLNPLRDRTFNLRGLAWANIGEFEKAVSDYTRAIRINPEFSAAYVNRENAVGELQRRGHRHGGVPEPAETARHTESVFGARLLTWQLKRS